MDSETNDSFVSVVNTNIDEEQSHALEENVVMMDAQETRSVEMSIHTGKNTSRCLKRQFVRYLSYLIMAKKKLMCLNRGHFLVGSQ